MMLMQNEKISRFMTVVAIIIGGIPFLLAFSPCLYGQIISQDRKIDWSPGIPGGIPHYPVGINVKDTPYNAKGDGITDDTQAIQRAIDDCQAGYAVYLPAGTYKTTGPINVFKKTIAIRGDGPNKTIIKNVADSGKVFNFYTWHIHLVVPITAGLQKGSKSIIVSDASNIIKGDFILINQENDTDTYGNLPNYMKRTVGQIVKVNGVSGNTIYLDRPLYFTYDQNMQPQIENARRQGHWLYKSGLEDLKIFRTNPKGDTITFNGGVYCWVKNVESDTTYNWHVRLKDCYGCEVVHSYFHHSVNYTGNGGYGVGLFQRSTDCLIEDNIFYHLRHAMLIEYGGAGNVFGYNYSKDPVNGSANDFLMGDMILHGGIPYMNLYEGNIGAIIMCDNELGGSRYNTYLRNHATVTSVPSVIYHMYGADIEENNLYENFVGNVFGSDATVNYKGSWRFGCHSAGNCVNPDPRPEQTVLRHGNYNYNNKTTQWDPEITDHKIPKSYYLSFKPAFFGNLPWPCMGPDLNPVVGKLPAKERFEAMSKEGTNNSPSSPPGSPSNLHY